MDELERIIARRVCELVTGRAGHVATDGTIQIRCKPRQVWAKVDGSELIFFVRGIFRENVIPGGARFNGACVTHKFDLSDPKSLISTKLRKASREASGIRSEHRVIQWVCD